ncbi:hypothetical protein [Undibacterium sp.]|jgi:hypothetical protein|uniref:hypothetical protein n=1 Tax=Undibacterium sp. TaxID=1914977 RepID=UPI002CB9676D|nr:hypothetical protein [Undibacterium sp.]HTD05057.1 hypothetical protein [Undibacterium sp.]
MNIRPLILGAGFCTALWLALFADKTPEAAIAEPVTRPSTLSKPASDTGASQLVVTANTSEPDTGSETAASKVMILALRERSDLIGTARTQDPIFVTQNWTPPPPPPPPVAPTPPPIAPPLPFTFIGKKYEDHKWEIYLAQGEQTYVASENTQIAGAYRIDKIEPPTMTLTYLPLNQIQTLNIGGAD